MQGHRPSMTDHRITRPENLPRSFSIQQATMANVGMPCMIVVSVEVSDTDILRQCMTLPRSLTGEKPEPLMH
jgi:hypothetical protein